MMRLVTKTTYLKMIGFYDVEVSHNKYGWIPENCSMGLITVLTKGFDVGGESYKIAYLLSSLDRYVDFYKDI